MFATYATNDPFNLNNTRNTRNTEQRDYNCAGYALGTFSWYCPDDEEHSPFWTLHGRTREYRVSAIQKMLDEFPNLRLIKNIDECADNEYVIAFRLAKDDFHYIKRGFNKVWYHKRGGGRIERISQDEVFDKTWCGRYKGKITLFAMRAA